MNLRSFLEQAEMEKDVLHIEDEVSTLYDIAFLIRECGNEGHMLLFEKVENHKTKVVANACGTRRRICKALDMSQSELYRGLAEAWRYPRKPGIASSIFFKSP